MILNYSRLEVKVLGLKMTNVGTQYMQKLDARVQCLGCGGNFKVTAELLSLKSKILSLDTPCPKCKR